MSKDKDSFSIHCIISENIFEKSMYDLGASINVMSYSIYTTLNIGHLIETSVIIYSTR